MERNGFYLQDDFSRVARFPNSLGNVDTTFWGSRSLLEVKGADAYAEAASSFEAPPPPPPHDLGLSSLTVASFQVTCQHMSSASCSTNPNVSQRAGKQSLIEIRRKVFLAELDGSGNPIPTATAYFKFSKLWAMHIGRCCGSHKGVPKYRKWLSNHQQ